jgi:hypothetical protein
VHDRSTINHDSLAGHKIAVCRRQEKQRSYQVFRLRIPFDGACRNICRAARVYNDATRGGRFDGPGSDAVVDLIMKTTGLKERDLFKSMIPNGISPDGAVIKRVSAKIYAFSSPKA